MTKPVLRTAVAAVTAALAAVALFSIGCGGGTSATPGTQKVPGASGRDGGIGALGRIEPGDGLVRIAARSLSGQASIVRRLLVNDGDVVRAGQPIAELDSQDELGAAAAAAAAEVEVARRRLAQVQAGAKPSDVAAQRAEVQRLQVEVAAADKELERYRRLGSNVTALEVDRLQARADTLRRALLAAEQRLTSLNEVREADTALAAAELEAAIRREARARAGHAASIIRAPVDGRVIDVHARAGEVVGAEGLMELAPTGPMYAVVEVPESDAARVRVGQRATVSGDGLAAPLAGTVERVGSLVREHRLLPVDPARFSDARVIEVRVRIDDAAAVAHLINLRVEVVIQP